MTLEPVKATAEVGENHELTDMKRRFWVGLALTLPVFVLEMGSHIPALGLHDLVSPQVSTWVQFALSTPVVLWAGWPFFQRAWASIVHRSLNMFSLIASRAFDDGADGFNVRPRSADSDRSVPISTKGTVASVASRQVVRSNIHAGISRQRPDSKPSKVQRKTAAVALSITAWTKTSCPNQG